MSGSTLHGFNVEIIECHQTRVYHHRWIKWVFFLTSPASHLLIFLFFSKKIQRNMKTDCWPFSLELVYEAAAVLNDSQNYDYYMRFKCTCVSQSENNIHTDHLSIQSINQVGYYNCQKNMFTLWSLVHLTLSSQRWAQQNNAAVERVSYRYWKRNAVNPDPKLVGRLTAVLVGQKLHELSQVNFGFALPPSKNA